MKETSLIAPIILISGGIAMLVLSYLSFKGKLSVRWMSGRHFWATREEKKEPDFKAMSKAIAFNSLLGGIAAILLGFYLLQHQPWMKSAVLILTLIIVLSNVIFGLTIGRKTKKAEKRYALKKKRVWETEDESEYADQDFSATETRIDILRFPIMMGCYVLLPVCAVAALLSFVAQIPLAEFGDPTSQALLLTFSLVLGPGCWILNRNLPKMTFSYQNGIFKKERNGKIEAFPRVAICKVVMESPVMPDYICFYLENRKNPVRVSMKGFKQDDRFDIPHMVARITKLPLTKIEKKVLDDFDK